jgi:tetratricopeptide (TPR) repeat protein
MYRTKLSHAGQINEMMSLEPWHNKKWLFSDLSLGGWRSFSIARDFFSQCNLAFPEIDTNRATSTDIKSNFDSGKIIGKGIDSEARGNINLINASLIAKQLIKYVEASGKDHVFFCIEPAFGNVWRDEDKLFLQYLNWYIGSSTHQIMFFSLTKDIPNDSIFNFVTNAKSLSLSSRLDCNKKQDVKQEQDSSSVSLDNIAVLIPGIISRDQINDLSIDVNKFKHILLPNGYVLIDPIERRNTTDLSSHFFDELVPKLKNMPWLAVYCRVKGSNHFLRPMECAQIAWEHYANGATEVAVEIMEHISLCTRDITNKAVLLCQLQGMRISLQLFDEVIEQALPQGNIPIDLENFLWQARGWGLVFSGQPQDAKYCFEKADKTYNREHIFEYLYFLNISALTEARLGNFNKALELELKIVEEHKSLPLTDHMLEYVNKLNTARLYRLRKDFKTAKDYYLAAFSTTNGCRTETDLFYVYASLALLAESQNNYKQAFFLWFTACIQWLGCKHPEAMGARALKVLINDPTELAPEEIVEKLAQEMLIKLRNVFEKSSFKWRYRVANIMEEKTNIVIPRVINLTIDKQHAKPLDLKLGQIGENWLWSSEQESTTELSVLLSKSISAKLLAQWLGALFNSANHDLKDASLKMPKVLMFANYDAQDISKNIESAKLCAWHYGITQYTYNGKLEKNLMVSLKEKRSHLNIKIGAAVNLLDIRNSKIYFKRYLPSEDLNTDQIKLLKLLKINELSEFELQSDIIKSWQPCNYQNLLMELEANYPANQWNTIIKEMEKKKLIAFEVNELQKGAVKC